MTTNEPKQPSSERPQRYVSHALVEVRRVRFIPFLAHSAVLLDISLSGFKIEFTGETSAHPGQTLWLTIPLSPLGIFAPYKFTCKVEVKWYDERRRRIGGVFLNLTPQERLIVEQLVAALNDRGALA